VLPIIEKKIVKRKKNEAINNLAEAIRSAVGGNTSS
jgi:hypothetical protein